MDFKDHFSGHSAEYSKFRPEYPQELIQFVVSKVHVKGTAWDCATGNGQAALALANYFDRIIATDASSSQIENAVPHQRVEYRVARGEDSGLPDQSVDLVTVAQGLHWFDHEEFFKEVKRVIKPQGVFSAWGYARLRIEPRIDQILDFLYSEVVGPYWWPERDMVETGYNTISFPFLVESHGFNYQIHWNLGQLQNYLLTWSACRRYMEEIKTNPLEQVGDELERAWGEQGRQRQVIFPNFLKLGQPVD